MTDIQIVGSGVVGTATGRGLVAKGHDVTFADVNPQRIDELASEGLSTELIGDDLTPLPSVTFIAVAALTNADGVDLTHLKEATVRIGRQIKAGQGAEWPTIIYRCTMPPRTMRDILIPLLEAESGKKAGEDFGVVYNPEYLRAVSAADDFLHPRLINVATLQENDRSHGVAADVLGDFDCPVEWLPIEVAEFHKYVNNVGNAIKISTYNYFRGLGQQIGLTNDEVDRAFKASARTAEGLWNPMYGLKDFGPYGGACLPKDTEGLRIYAVKNGLDTSMLDATQAVNNAIIAGGRLAVEDQ